jgi:hypothetical protein
MVPGLPPHHSARSQWIARQCQLKQVVCVRAGLLRGPTPAEGVVHGRLHCSL